MVTKEKDFEGQEQLIFKKNKTASAIFCIIMAGVSLIFFLYVSIKVWETTYSGKIYWYFLFLALCGIVPIPYMACQCFYKNYCCDIGRMGNEMRISLSDEFMRNRRDEMQDPVDKIVCAGELVLLSMVLMLGLVFPDIMLYHI